MSVSKNPRIIQRITISNHNGANRQAVIRTPSGAIDYDHYFAQARQSRSKAYASVFTDMIQIAKRVWHRLALQRGTADNSKPCENNCPASG